MDNISLEIYYQPVFTDKEILIQFSNGTYERENQTSLYFLSLVKLRTVTKIPLQWWVYLFHKICKTCQFVSQKLLIRANLLRTWKQEGIFVNPVVEILIQVKRSKGHKDMCYCLYFCHSIKSTLWLKSNFHLEIQIFMISFNNDFV